MRFYDLATRCQEAGRRNEATTMSAISYLPTQVGTVRAALKGLGKKKGKWNLEVREGDGCTSVRFEDALEITVPQEHWETFQEMFDGQLLSGSSFELPVTLLQDSLDESEDSLIEKRMDEIRSLVEEKLQGPMIQEASNVVFRWISRFGRPDDEHTSARGLFRLPCTSEGMDNFVSELTEDCKGDLGQLEILLQKMQDFQSLRESYFFAGARISSRYQGVNMVFEAHTGWDNLNTFSIAIDDDDVADALEEATVDVLRINNTFYPTAAQMADHLGIDNFICVLKETIETIEDMIGTGDDDESDS